MYAVGLSCNKAATSKGWPRFLSLKISFDMQGGCSISVEREVPQEINTIVHKTEILM